MLASTLFAPENQLVPAALLDAPGTGGVGIVHFNPVFVARDPTQLVDLTYAHVNPTAQRLLGLPAQPTDTLLTGAPRATDLFAFYREAFWAEEVRYYAGPYPLVGGPSLGWRVAAQRYGEQLVVSFLEAAPIPSLAGPNVPTPAHSIFYQAFDQTKAAISFVSGPEHRLMYLNPQFEELFEGLDLRGRPVAEALPEDVAPGLAAQFIQVYETGVASQCPELPLRVGPAGSEAAQLAYFNFTFQAYQHDGQTVGVSAFGYEVTEQVLARRQVQRLHAEQQVLNEELLVANEELRANNEALAQVQWRLQLLNQELEIRVAAGVAEAERQQQLVARFFHQTPAAICVLDGPDLVYELVNPAYQQFFPGQPLLGRPAHEVWQGVGKPQVSAWLRQVYETGVTHEGHEVPLPVAGGPSPELPQSAYFNCIYQARYDEHGRIDGVLVFALDVTVQVQAQQRAEELQVQVRAAIAHRAQEREAFYQLFAHSPAAIALLRGPEFLFEYLNETFAELFFGYELLNRPLGEALPPADRLGYLSLLEQLYQTGETLVRREWPLVLAQRGGRPAITRYFNSSYQVYRENGEISGIFIFAYDVTEQVLARQQREDGLVQLQNLFEQAPVAIFVLRGPHYVFEVVNSLMSKVLGRSSAELLGQPYSEAAPELVAQGYQSLLDEVWQTGTPRVVQEQPAQLPYHRVGEVGYFTFVFHPLRDAYGQLTGITCVSTDVTEQVWARQQVQQLNKELQAANQELNQKNKQLVRTNADLDTFIYTASHDLKAPITNIESLLLLLRQQLPAAAQQAGLVPRVLGMMQGAIERFQLTLVQLTDLSRLQQLNAEPPETVDLAALVEAVRLDLAPMLEAAGAQLTVDVAACAAVLFAPQYLRSVVYNLLSNAVKYRHPSRVPLVHLYCYPSATGAVLEVQDNGLGLSVQQQGKLFGLFTRLHAHVEGSGVGLYMVKRIVENAGGTITVQSQLGIGSTFTVHIP
jgi:PAS domain S-box-containing protein